jgi:hypothetical protein
MKLPSTDFTAPEIATYPDANSAACRQRCIAASSPFPCTAFSITAGSETPCVLKGASGARFGRLNSSTPNVSSFLPVGYHIAMLSFKYQPIPLSESLNRSRPCECKQACSRMDECSGFLLTDCNRNGTACRCNLYNVATASNDTYPGSFMRLYIKGKSRVCGAEQWGLARTRRCSTGAQVEL